MDAHLQAITANSGEKIIDLIHVRDESPERPKTPARRSDRLAEKVKRLEQAHLAKQKADWEADDAARQLRREVANHNTSTVITVPFGTDLSEVILNDANLDLVEINFY